MQEAKRRMNPLPSLLHVLRPGKLGCHCWRAEGRSGSTKMLVSTAVAELNSICETMANLLSEMKRTAALLPEFPIVSEFYGVGDTLGPRLMAEIGDIYRFKHKGSLGEYQ